MLYHPFDIILLVGLASHSFKTVVRSDVPARNQFIPVEHLKTKECRKNCIKVIKGVEYISYENALISCNLEKLSKRWEIGA